jgi:hypothetical protein
MQRVDFIPDNPTYPLVRVLPVLCLPRLGLFSSDVVEVGRKAARHRAWTANRRSGRPARVSIVEQGQETNNGAEASNAS